MTRTLLLLILFVAFACAQQNNNVPNAVSSKFKTLYPEAEELEWSKEDPNFEAEFELNDIEMSVVFDAEGKVLETETEIKMEDLPEPVKLSLKNDFDGYEAEEPAKLEKNGEVFYEVELEKGDVEFDGIFSKDGKLVNKETDDNDEKSKDQDKDDDNIEHEEDGDDQNKDD